MVPNKESLLKKSTKNNKARRDLNPRLRFLKECNLLSNRPFPLNEVSLIDNYLYARLDTWEFSTKTENGTPSMDTVGVARGDVGRDEHGEARRANTTSNDWPHLDLERLRLKPWSKSHFSIAETTWPTCLYMIYLHV